MRERLVEQGTNARKLEGLLSHIARIARHQDDRQARAQLVNLARQLQPALIVLLGGGFILYTAVKDIFHMLAPSNISEHTEGPAKVSVPRAITMIVLMNLAFSFDSILGAIVLTKNFAVMAIAVVISGGLMMWLACRVAAFLQKNRMYELLGLFVLLLVGVMLLSEGGHLAHLAFFGHAMELMAESTFYFVIAVLVVVDLVQGRYQTKLLAMNPPQPESASPPP